jgi:hypothetical protein
MCTTAPYQGAGLHRLQYKTVYPFHRYGNINTLKYGQRYAASYDDVKMNGTGRVVGIRSRHGLAVLSVTRGREGQEGAVIDLQQTGPPLSVHDGYSSGSQRWRISESDGDGYVHIALDGTDLFVTAVLSQFPSQSNLRLKRCRPGDSTLPETAKWQIAPCTEHAGYVSIGAKELVSPWIIDGFAFSGQTVFPILVTSVNYCRI